MRYRIGEALARLADWLRYPPLVTCQRPGCGYVDGGVHAPAQSCVNCKDPLEHHAFVPPPWWRRIGAAR